MKFIHKWLYEHMTLSVEVIWKATCAHLETKMFK